MGCSCFSELINSSDENLLPLLLLSLTKIQNFKAYFKGKSELYQNKNQLIQIFIGLIKNENLVYDIVYNNRELLKKSNSPFSIKKFYKLNLLEINKQLEEINKNISNAPPKSIIKELFWGKKKKVSKCPICNETIQDEKEKIICLAFNMENINYYFDASKMLSRTRKYTKNEICKNNKNKADFNIECIYDLPNIVLIILYNCKKNKNIDINFVLSKQTSLGFKFELICFITRSEEMVYNENKNQWYLYSNKDKKNEKIKMNLDEIENYNPIVFLYQKMEKKIKLDEAIIEYVELQNEIENFGKNQVKQLYLVPKKFFDEILELVDINPDNLSNKKGQIKSIKQKIEEKKNELMNMEQIEIIDDQSYNKKDFTFVNEKILNKLGIKKEEYEKKQIKLNKIGQNKFILIFNNEAAIGIEKEGKQIKILCENNNFHINNFEDIKIFYDILSNIFEQQKKISKSIEENKIDENKLENYYIINAKWFNKMIKIFESDEIYDDDNYKIESFDRITNIINLNENELKIKNDLFLKRKQILMDENLFKVEYEEKSGLKYPNKFVIIKENTLNELLNKLQIAFKKIQKNIYQIFYGEHYLFIRDNNEKNKYLVCSQKCIEFNVEIIFIFKDDNSFQKEINNYIKNRNGFKFYFKERSIDTKNSQFQKLINKEQVELGNAIIINNISIDNNNENNEKLNQEIIQDYIKSLFLLLMKIEKLKNYFINTKISQENKISFLLSDFIKNFQNDKKNLPNIINNAINEIKKLKEKNYKEFKLQRFNRFYFD